MTFVRSTLPLLLMAIPPLAGQPKPVIDNEQVRVLMISAKPHSKSASHVHSRNRVMIYLNAGGDTFLPDRGPAEDLKSQAGEVRWRPAGGLHTGEGIGKDPYRVVEVELKNQGRSVQTFALDPVKVVPQIFKVLFDNRQVRVLRVRIGAKEKLPFHEHGFNRVVVYLTDTRVLVTDESGKATEAAAKAGEIRWAGAGKHSEENLEDRPVEVIVVESK